MVLDEIDFDRVAVFPFEGDAPRAIDIHSPSHRLITAIGMKPQAGQLQIVERFGVMQRIENLKRTLCQILSDLRSASFLKKLSCTFVNETLNRHPNLRANASPVDADWI